MPNKLVYSSAEDRVIGVAVPATLILSFPEDWSPGAPFYLHVRRLRKASAHLGEALEVVGIEPKDAPVRAEYLYEASYGVSGIRGGSPAVRVRAALEADFRVSLENEDIGPLYREHLMAVYPVAISMGEAEALAETAAVPFWFDGPTFSAAFLLDPNHWEPGEVVGILPLKADVDLGDAAREAARKLLDLLDVTAYGITWRRRDSFRANRVLIEGAVDRLYSGKGRAIKIGCRRLRAVRVHPCESMWGPAPYCFKDIEYFCEVLDGRTVYFGRRKGRYYVAVPAESGAHIELGKP